MANVLTFCDYFLPGFKGGGPITTVSNLARRLGDRQRFRVVTRDRDLGDTQPYLDLPTGSWTRIGGIEVLYLPQGLKGARKLASVIGSEEVDLIYLNSFHSVAYALRPMIIARHLRPRLPIILAPRGEFALPALALSSARKRVYREALSRCGLLDGVTFQASTSAEADDIRLAIGPHATIVVAPDLTDRHTAAAGAERVGLKQPGLAKLVFLGRLSPIKNLDWFLRQLNGLRGRLELNVVGPVENPHYWMKCLETIARLPKNVEVRLIGAVAPEQVAAHLGRSDALVLPSLSENFAHVVPQALAAGCPVLVSDRTPWFRVEAEGCGWRLPLEDPHRWQDTLNHLVEMEEAAHAQMRRAAIDLASRFTEDPAAVEANARLFEQ